jgi:hypothetical protein
MSPYVFDRLSNTSPEELQSGNIMASNTILGQDVDPSLLSCDGEPPEAEAHASPGNQLDSNLSHSDRNRPSPCLSEWESEC